MKRFIFVLLAAAAMTARAADLDLRHITITNDIAGTRPAVSPLKWFQGESVKVDIYAVRGTNALDTSGTSMTCRLEAFIKTSITTAYLMETGTVNSTGHCAFDITPERANLPTNIYTAFVKLYQSVSGTNRYVGTVYNGDLQILTGSSATNYVYQGPYTNSSETDPVFSASVAGRITASDTSRWNTVSAGGVVSWTAGTGLTNAGTATDPTGRLNAASIASLGLADTAVQPGFTLTESEHGSLGGSNRHALADSSKAGFMSALEYLQLQALGTSSNTWNGYGATISGLQSTQGTVVAWQNSVSGRLDNAGALTNIPVWAAATNATTVTGVQSGTIETALQPTLLSTAGNYNNWYSQNSWYGTNYYRERALFFDPLDSVNASYDSWTGIFKWNGTAKLNISNGVMTNMAVVSGTTILASGTNIGNTVASQGVTIGTLQTSNANLYAAAITNGGTYSALTVTNFTAAGNINGGGNSLTNFSTLSDPSILTGVSNTITLGGSVNHYYWDLTNNSQITFAPCISNKGSKASIDVNKSGFNLTLNSESCITNGLGNISICTNVAESGRYTYLLYQGVMGTNVYARKIGVYQLQ